MNIFGIDDYFSNDGLIIIIDFQFVRCLLPVANCLLVLVWLGRHLKLMGAGTPGHLGRFALLRLVCQTRKTRMQGAGCPVREKQLKQLFYQSYLPFILFIPIKKCLSFSPSVLVIIVKKISILVSFNPSHPSYFWVL